MIRLRLFYTMVTCNKGLFSLHENIHAQDPYCVKSSTILFTLKVRCWCCCLRTWNERTSCSTRSSTFLWLKFYCPERTNSFPILKIKFSGVGCRSYEQIDKYFECPVETSVCFIAYVSALHCIVYIPDFLESFQCNFFVFHTDIVGQRESFNMKFITGRYSGMERIHSSKHQQKCS